MFPIYLTRHNYYGQILIITLTGVLDSEKLLRFLYVNALCGSLECSTLLVSELYVQHLNHYASLLTKTDVGFDFFSILSLYRIS